MSLLNLARVSKAEQYRCTLFWRYRYEIILTDYEIFFLEKCEIKFAFSYCEAIFHTRSVFHSEAISLAAGEFH